ncbi:MAG TPA: hypothetical protein VFC78_01295 [Tepidisphaeraceae bacterium]|nr:hypothetical protein [Tepidisphaeraceae bacterium]
MRQLFGDAGPANPHQLPATDADESAVLNDFGEYILWAKVKNDPIPNLHSRLT